MKQLKIKTRQTIDDCDWDELVRATYGKPYKFQQQDGCKMRSIETITVSDGEYDADDYENDSVPDVVNGDEMGVSFAAWLARDPKEWNGAPEDKKSWTLDLFWHRNFYPSIDMVASDLHKRGLLPAGEHDIIIDW